MNIKELLGIFMVKFDRLYATAIDHISEEDYDKLDDLYLSYSYDEDDEFWITNYPLKILSVNDNIIKFGLCTVDNSNIIDILKRLNCEIEFCSIEKLNVTKDLLDIIVRIFSDEYFPDMDNEYTIEPLKFMFYNIEGEPFKLNLWRDEIGYFYVLESNDFNKLLEISKQYCYELVYTSTGIVCIIRSEIDERKKNYS